MVFICEMRNLGRNLGCHGAKCETKFGYALREKERKANHRIDTVSAVLIGHAQQPSNRVAVETLLRLLYSA